MKLIKIIKVFRRNKCAESLPYKMMISLILIVLMAILVIGAILKAVKPDFM